MRNSLGKKVMVSVTNDLVTDQRVHKVCMSLTNAGFDVLLIGRRLRDSMDPGSRNYRVKRFKLFFNRTVLFYAEYNIRLFFFLFFKRFDICLSNDLDTLPANYMVSRIQGKKLVYDSHEYFTEVPELVNRPMIRKCWEWMESRMLPHVRFAYTVSPSIADAYHKKYGVEFKVVRNFPVLNETKTQPELLLRTGREYIILYQGVVNVDRGLEELILAMQEVANAVLFIAGDGDIRLQLEDLVEHHHLRENVKFLGKLPFDQLSTITAQADVGVSIEKPRGLNYAYALPNKLFDYVHAEIPVLVSHLVEVEQIMRTYEIGTFIDEHDPSHIAGKLNELLADKKRKDHFKSQLQKAKQEYSWQREEETLLPLF